MVGSAIAKGASLVAELVVNPLYNRGKIEGQGHHPGAASVTTGVKEGNYHSWQLGRAWVLAPGWIEHDVRRWQAGIVL